MSPETSTRTAANGTVPVRNLKSDHRWQNAGHAVLFVILALAAVQCARLGGAGLLVQTAAMEVERWTSASRSPSTSEINRAVRYYADSLHYAADNPWALEGLGALDLASMRASKIPREALDATKEAHLRFRQALIQRPTSPYLWANLALTKLYLDEIDDEFMTALRYANEFGPWEPATQQTTLFVGLAAWQKLDLGLRQALVQTIERGGLRDAQKMFDIVKSYGRFDLVCDMDKYKKLAAKNCNKAATAANSGESAKGLSNL